MPASAMTSNRLTSLPEEDASQLSCTRAQTSDSRSSSQTAEGADHNPSVHVRHWHVSAVPGQVLGPGEYPQVPIATCIFM